MDDLTGWAGRFDVVIKHKNGTTEKHTIKNRITNAALDAMRDVLNGDINDLEIKYIAVGDDEKPLDNDDTTLGNERFRTDYVDSQKPGLGQLQKTAIILE